MFFRYDKNSRIWDRVFSQSITTCLWWLVYLINLIGVYYFGIYGKLLFLSYIICLCMLMISNLSFMSLSIGIDLPIFRLNLCLLLSGVIVFIKLWGGAFLNYEIVDVFCNWSSILIVWMIMLWSLILDYKQGDIGGMFSYINHSTFASYYILMFFISLIVLVFGTSVDLHYEWCNIDSVFWLWYFVLLILSSMIGGWFFGKVFGNRLVSYRGYLGHGETLEGYAGSVIVSILVSVLSGYWFVQQNRMIPIFAIIVCGCLLSIICILGSVWSNILRSSCLGNDSEHEGVHKFVIYYFDNCIFSLPIYVAILGMLDHFLSI